MSRSILSTFVLAAVLIAVVVADPDPNKHPKKQHKKEEQVIVVEPLIGNIPLLPLMLSDN